MERKILSCTRGTKFKFFKSSSSLKIFVYPHRQTSLHQPSAMSRPGHTCHENLPCCQQNHKRVVIGKLTGTGDRGLEKGILCLVSCPNYPNTNSSVGPRFPICEMMLNQVSMDPVRSKHLHPCDLDTERKKKMLSPSPNMEQVSV